jgi:hypothetical protein
MADSGTSNKLHLELCIEQDLEGHSRYIEFCETNFSVVSSELAHLLFAAAPKLMSLPSASVRSPRRKALLQ